MAGPRWSKVGRHVRYRWSDIEKWLDQQAKGGPHRRNRPTSSTLTSAITASTITHPPIAWEGA